MTSAEKLAKLLTSGGGSVSPTWLGKEIEKRAGLRSGYNLVYKWRTGERPLTRRNRELVEEICALKAGALLGDDGDAPDDGGESSSELGHPSLHSFVAGSRAKAMKPPPTSIEIVALARHHVGDQDPGEDYYYYTLLAERARKAMPSMRPNVASGAAARAGAKKITKVKTPASKKARGHLRALSDDRE